MIWLRPMSMGCVRVLLMKRERKSKGMPVRGVGNARVEGGDARVRRGRLGPFYLVIGFVLLAGGPGTGWAQVLAGAASPLASSTAAPAGAVVTGRVVCADTQRAARFAQVLLVPTSTEANEGEGGRGFGRYSGRTDLDGNYSIAGVPAGDYYVTGQLTGYVNRMIDVQAAANSPQNNSAALTGVPVVHVSAGGASAQLSLQRGSVIAGRIQWDDGSPAAGVQVSAQPAADSTTSAKANGQGRPGGGFFGFGTQTDDCGFFRLTGLASGSYVVRANVLAPTPQRGEDRSFARNLNIYVYAPDKMRRADAVTITLAAGEEHDDVAVTLGLTMLPTVSGTVSATGAAVRSGSVNLTDQTDATLNRTGVINADGSFVVPYLPAGNYALRVNASAHLQGPGGRGGPSAPTPADTVRFPPLQAAVTGADGDVTGVALTVTVANGPP